MLFGPLIGDEPLKAQCSCSVFTGNGQLLGDNDAIPGPCLGGPCRWSLSRELFKSFQNEGHKDLDKHFLGRNTYQHHGHIFTLYSYSIIYLRYP